MHELLHHAPKPRFDVDAIRARFPALAQTVRGKPLVYLDSAASAQKPASVIDALVRAYSTDYANVHRGAYELSARATLNFERARESVARFINAPSPECVVFTKGATESANLAAFGLAETCLKPGDEVLATLLEHHANLLPWEQACKRTGAVLKLVPVLPEGDLDMAALKRMAGPRTKIMAFTLLSNALGTVTPAEEIISVAKACGAVTVADAAQAAAHGMLDVQALDCDFLFFSGHKMYGPCGIGVLYGKPERLTALPPWQTGGEMVDRADPIQGSTWAPPPLRFEAGTPAFPEASALGEAVAFLTSLDRKAIQKHESALTRQIAQEIAAMPGFRVIGDPKKRECIVPFVHERAASSDLGELLDMEGVAVRAGHHCASPLMRAMGLHATARASVAMYNTEEDALRFLRALRRAATLI